MKKILKKLKTSFSELSTNLKNQFLLINKEKVKSPKIFYPSDKTTFEELNQKSPITIKMYGFDEKTPTLGDVIGEVHSVET